MDDETGEEINIPKLIQAQNKKKAKGGFQALGLSRPVLKGILHKGYKLPTPIQRRTIPIILEGKDVVAMARTGSGKTAAFLVPLFEKLKVHAAKVGARGLILSPTRELALQTLSFAKELGKYTGLRAAAILGGESMEIQFAALHENPDIIIATPGRFMHVCVEMNLKLDTVEYVVFDEADRLFEMGFKEQLSDILKRLSVNRQTVLFSATLPKMLVEFARAGLNDPTLIRLDAETKLSENLKLGFFKLNSEDKLPFLIYLLENVVNKEEPTVVFLPTKHHVEYLYKLLTTMGFSATYVYSSLDASARKINIAKFRAKRVNLLIVTDIAARGLDIPLLDNVINFNFPPKAKLFIHRVGRVARAGRSGTAYSFVSPDELPYLLELHMFLSKSVKLCPALSENSCISGEEDWDRMLGSVPREIINENEDFIRRQLELSYDLEVLRKSSENGLMKYRQTCPAASRATLKRLKEELWGIDVGFHPLFREFTESPLQQKRFEMLEKLKNVRPKLTVFELHNKNDKKKNLSCFMQEKRKIDGEKIESFHKKMALRKEKAEEMMQRQKEAQEMDANVDEPSELEVVNTFSKIIGKTAKSKSLSANCSGLEVKRDDMSQNFIPYKPADYDEEQGYSVMSNFEKETARASLDLIGDDEHAAKLNNQPRMKWDRKLKKFRGQDQEKKIKTESGAWVSASYKKDLYQKWKMRMHPQQETEEGGGGEDGGNEVEWRRDSLDWRGKGKKNFGTKKEKGFVSLTETGYRNRPHPLVKDRKVGKVDQKALRKATGAASQVRSYEEKVKNIKMRNKIKFKYSRKRHQSTKRKGKKSK